MLHAMSPVPSSTHAPTPKGIKSEFSRDSGLKTLQGPRFGELKLVWICGELTFTAIQGVRPVAPALSTRAIPDLFTPLPKTQTHISRDPAACLAPFSHPYIT